MSEQGERGKTGDHGQDGQRGARGLRGEQGETGPVIMSKRQVLVLFLFVTMCFVLLAVRTEINDRHNRQTNRELCRFATKEATNVNGILDAVITAVKNTDTLSPAEKKSRLTLYQGAKVQIPDCP